MEQKEIEMNIFETNDVVSNAINDFDSWVFFLISKETPTLMNLIEKLAISGLSRSETTFLDIGSNIGWFSLQIAANGYNVISIDALKLNGDMFIDSFCRNDLENNIKFFNVGLGEKEEECITFSIKGNVGNANILCGKDNIKVPDGFELRGKTKTYRLDSIIDTDIQVLKIDTEGFEYYALKGGSKLFEEKRVKYLVTLI